MWGSTMNKHTYGVNTKTNGYIDTSKTERGAKQYATIHGYDEIYKRFNNGYNLELIARKVAGKWQGV